VIVFDTLTLKQYCSMLVVTVMLMY